MNVYEEIVGIIARVLEVDSGSLSEDTAIGDIPAWDSLRHLQIIAEVEKHFSLRFTPDVLMDMEDVGDITAAVQERI